VGSFTRIPGKRREPIALGGSVVTIRSAEIASRLAAPTGPNFAVAEVAEPCERCGEPLAEMFITTGGALGDPDVWRDHPIAVDGWACAGCGVFRYPRKIDPQRIQELTEEGVAAGRSGDFAAAELCFARIVWNWPGYFPGHLNYAEATRDRLADRKPDDPAVERRLVERMVDQYEAAVAAFEEQPTPSLVAGAARAYRSLADQAIEARAADRARRLLETCLRLDGLPAEDEVDARTRLRYLERGGSQFDEARATLMPYLALDDREARAISTGDDRRRVVSAVETLSEIAAHAPDLWEATWLIAKAKQSLGDIDGAIADLQRAHEAAPDAEPVARDLSMLLLERDEVHDAREVARAIAAARPNAANLCNLAVTELLCGDLGAADAALTRSEELDPEDPVARAVRSRIERYRAGGPLPRTMRELERG